MIGNVEGDELLMSVCTSVGKREYVIEFPSGFQYKLHGRYKEKGRFNRRSVEKVLKKLGRDTSEKCEIKLNLSYDGQEDIAMRIMKKKIQKLYYLTGCNILNFFVGDTEKSNFRFQSAVTQPYKGNRGEKPHIYDFLREYLINAEGATVAVGYEADDMLGIYQTNDTVAIHCDKDINMIPGKHFNTMQDVSWFASDPGELCDSGSNIKGYGLKLFYAQLLMGDATDSIPPILKTAGKGWGVRGVVKLLDGVDTESGLLNTVIDCYKESLGWDAWYDRLMEQADLVWICRELGVTGSDYIKSKL